MSDEATHTSEEVTTSGAMEAVANERAPRPNGGRVNRRIVCADGFKVSVQASDMHYATDSAGRRPYWGDEPTSHPFRTFEIGATSAAPEPSEMWDEYESGGVWAWVPWQVVADLLDLHGGAVAWEQSSRTGPEQEDNDD